MPIFGSEVPARVFQWLHQVRPGASVSQIDGVVLDGREMEGKGKEGKFRGNHGEWEEMWSMVLL